MTRSDYLAWAKLRAIEYVDLREPAMAVSSFISDINKSSEPIYDPLAWRNLLRLLMTHATDASPSGLMRLRDFIEGFN